MRNMSRWVDVPCGCGLVFSHIHGSNVSCLACRRWIKLDWRGTYVPKKKPKKKLDDEASAIIGKE